MSSLLPIFAGAAVMLLLRGGSRLDAVSRLRVTLAGFPGASIQGGRAFLTIPVSVDNATAEVFRVKNIFARILVNGIFTGDITTVQPFTIPAFGSVTVSLSASLTLNNSVILLVDALLKKSGAVELVLQGSVQSDSLTVPLYIVRKL